MLLDALDTLDLGTSLTGIAAGGTQYSNVLDLSVSRDISVAKVPVSTQFSTLPTSGTGGATLNVFLQTSADNATWQTLMDNGNPAISMYNALNEFAFRGWLPAGVLRYIRMGYTPSAVLTAGVVYSQLGGDWPRNKQYPRNYVA